MLRRKALLRAIQPPLGLEQRPKRNPCASVRNTAPIHDGLLPVDIVSPTGVTCRPFRTGVAGVSRFLRGRSQPGGGAGAPAGREALRGAPEQVAQRAAAALLRPAAGHPLQDRSLSLARPEVPLRGRFFP